MKTVSNFLQKHTALLIQLAFVVLVTLLLLDFFVFTQAPEKTLHITMQFETVRDLILEKLQR